MKTHSEVTILLAEDDPGHARLIEKNLRRGNINNEITIVGDGQSVLDYLYGKGEFAGRSLRSHLLLLLDLNLPVLDGYQVLMRIRNDEQIRHIPVIILTTTDDAQEVSRCYQLGCSVYITKPVDYNKFAEAVQRLGLFLSIVTIPEGGRNIHE